MIVSTIAGTKEMCDKLVNSLSWIDTAPNTEMTQKLKIYRQQLIDLPDTITEGQYPVYPDDPRTIDCGC
jgi:hypothetical protein